MCGICGIVSWQGLSPGDRELLPSMCRSLVHRGPDDEGCYFNDYAAIGMRRLSVIDLEGGSQPIANESNTIRIVFNGEIYNFPELRTELEGLGYRFRTRSDTEAILHAYEAFGDNCVRRLNGMFAFTILDSYRNRLFCARDRMGQKPFYYAHSGNRFVFGSELKAVLCDRSIPRQPDFEAIHHYLTLQYVPSPYSAFQGVRKLPPAHTLVFDRAGIHLSRYWDISFNPGYDRDEDEAAGELRELVTRSVKRRMISDVPLGAFLSGGIDSSIIVNRMSLLAQHPVKTFSIGFASERFNELPYAKAQAKHCKTDHHEFIVTPSGINELLPRLIDCFDEPYADSSAYQTYYLAMQTRQEVTVALNGDGGDEIFAGYPRYRLDRLIRPYSYLPAVVTQKIVPSLVNRLREPLDIPLEANWISGLKRLAQVARTSPKASIIRWGSYFDEVMKRWLYTPEMRRTIGSTSSSALLESSFDHADGMDFLNKSLYVDMTNYLPGDILVKADRMSMAHSLETRSPFLDHEVVAFAARLPVRFKLRGRTTKHILRRAFADSIPPDLLKRGKRGFAAPVEEWLRTDLRHLLHEVLLENRSTLPEIIRRNRVRQLVTEHEQGVQNHGRRLWALIILAMWFNRLKS